MTTTIVPPTPTETQERIDAAYAALWRQHDAGAISDRVFSELYDMLTCLLRLAKTDATRARIARTIAEIWK